jgi:tetratricopeptide (TPR) repeat protein
VVAVFPADPPDNGRPIVTGRRIFRIALILAWAAGLWGCGSPDPERDLKRGRAEIAAGRYENAVQPLRRYVYHAPDSHEAHFLLGKAFFSQAAGEEDDLYRARYYYRRARELARTSAEKAQAAEGYARAMLVMGRGGEESAMVFEDLAEAEASAGKPLEAARLYFEAGCRFLGMGLERRAMDAFTSGLEAAPVGSNLGYLRRGLATAALLADRPQAALEALEPSPGTTGDADDHVAACPLLPDTLIQPAAEFLMADPQGRPQDFQKTLTLFGRLMKMGGKTNPADVAPADRPLYRRAWLTLAGHARRIGAGEMAARFSGQARQYQPAAE